MKNALYDSYIKAFRWSTDRLNPDEGGVIGFVTNGAWLDGNSQDGFRKIIEKEFDSIYVFNLRGNQRTSGELSRKEGGKIFGSGSRTPIAITLLVRNPITPREKAIIKYHDIGDYLGREEKLKIIDDFGSITNPNMKLVSINPNNNGDWINQRSDKFQNLISLEPVASEPSFFSLKSWGLKSNRDIWTVGSSKHALEKRIFDMISFYNAEMERFNQKSKVDSDIEVKDFISKDTTKISWSRSLRRDVEKGVKKEFYGNSLAKTLFRPFFKQRLYYSRDLIEEIGKIPTLFPKVEQFNLAIVLTGKGASKDFSAILTDSIPNLDTIEKAQCFPLFHYEEQKKQTPGLFDQEGESEYIRHDGITDFILSQAQKQYGKSLSKEDIFFYVYGILHSPVYRETFANDLKKMLPRIPLVDSPNDFWKFSKAGKSLADLHLNYESFEPYPDVEVEGQHMVTGREDYEFYRVSKMRFLKKDQKDTIIYNGQLTIKNIPEKAYEYVVNGKSAIEWIMERYQVKTDKKSGITNDPNDWSKEHENPSYIFNLLLSIINVSVQTVDIVNELPKLKFD